MRKLFFLVISIFFLHTVFSIPSLSQSDPKQFGVDVLVTYEVAESGVTKITHDITIENLVSEFYAKNYALSLSNIDPINPTSYQGSKKLNLSVKKDGDITEVSVNFDDAVIGKGAKRTFTINFEEKSFIKKTGEVWEIAIPRLSNIDYFRQYNITLLVPKDLGQEAYLSPSAESSSESDTHRIYNFDKGRIAKVGITGGFGEFQVFSFSLKYHLENPLVKNVLQEIAVPPDTDFQRVYYQEVTPKPVKIEKDLDDNWIATYELPPRGKLDVKAVGVVQIFSEPVHGFVKNPPDPVETIKPTKYWQSDDLNIIDLAKRLKTPELIYDYVINTLSYDYDRVRPNAGRLGAKGALENPKNSICMEFTDLFIAIARAAGISTREVNGYAYTENPQIEPLSLVADVLHAWPQYWDEDRNIWVSIDPTWGSTTGGVDFFNKLDLRHFAFVIHSSDPEKPYPAGSYKLGPNPEKDVFVSFGNLPKEKVKEPEIKVQVRNIPLLRPTVILEVDTVAPTAIYKMPLDVYYDNRKSETIEIEELLPFSNYKKELNMPYSFLGFGMPEKIQIYFRNTYLEVPTSKMETIVYNLVSIVLLIAACLIFILFRFKKLKLLNVARPKKDSIG